MSNEVYSFLCKIGGAADLNVIYQQFNSKTLIDKQHVRGYLDILKKKKLANNPRWAHWEVL